MSTVREARDTLEAALRAPEHKTWGVYRDPGTNMQTPAVVVGHPSLRWEAAGRGATSATFPVWVVVDAVDSEVEKLADLVVEVGDVIDGTTDAVVVQANPDAYPVGTTELPCYLILTEVSLQ